MSVKWVSLLGDFEQAGNRLTFKGGVTEEKIAGTPRGMLQVGNFLSDRAFGEGAISANIEFVRSSSALMPIKLLESLPYSPTGDLGPMDGVFSGHSLEGEWIEIDGHGEIRMAFSEDWSSFDAEYNVATNPEKWYGDWKGHLRQEEGVATFERDGIEFRCR